MPGVDWTEPFRPGPPPALTSNQYTKDYNEVKTVGVTGLIEERSHDREVVARFYAASSQTFLFLTAARQLASRARRRVKGADVPAPDPDLARQRDVVDAFFLAARGGDFDALVALLDPDVVLRADGGTGRPAASRVIHGRAAVAGQALMFALPDAELRPALVNGAAGVVVTFAGQPVSVMGFTVAEGKVLEIDAIADPERVRRIAAAVLSDDESGTAGPQPE